MPETDAVAKSMESMINLDGANLILATSFGYYKPFVVDLAKKYPDVAVPPRRAAVEQGQGPEERRLLFRLSQPGALRRRRRRRPVAPSRTRSASSPPSRSPSVLQQHQLGPARRPQGQSERDRAGDLHRRLVAAGARGRSHQRAGRRRLRRHHLPRRRPEGRDRDRREAAASRPAATMPRQAPLAPKGFITGAEYKWETIYKGYADRPRRGQAAAELHRRRLRQRHGAEHAVRRRRDAGGDARPPTAAIADAARRRSRSTSGRSRTTTARSSIDKDLRQLRPLPRRHELPARRRRRLDHLIDELAARAAGARRLRCEPCLTMLGGSQAHDR